MAAGRILVALFAAFLALSTGAAPAPAFAQAGQFRAGAAVPEAGEFISKMASEAIGGLADKTLSPEERVAKFRQLLATGFDVPYIGRFVLGRYWRIANDAEKNEFLKLFEDFIVKTYADRFRDYSGENLRIGAAKADDATQATVFSDILRPSGPPVKVEWRVERQESGFKIVDVVVEGVSMSITQRDDFSSVIQRNGGKVENLNKVLRDKLAAK